MDVNTFIHGYFYDIPIPPSSDKVKEYGTSDLYLNIDWIPSFVHETVYLSKYTMHLSGAICIPCNCIYWVWLPPAFLIVSYTIFSLFQHPETLDLKKMATTSSVPRGEELWPPGTVRLEDIFQDKDNGIILSPTPSSDPNDPLNWCKYISILFWHYSLLLKLTYLPMLFVDSICYKYLLRYNSTLA